MKTSVRKGSGLFGNEITEVRDKIATIRSMQVIADADVAALYGVQTKEVNQAVRNNPDKFPDTFYCRTENGLYIDSFLKNCEYTVKETPNAYRIYYVA